MAAFLLASDLPQPRSQQPVHAWSTGPKAVVGYIIFAAQSRWSLLAPFDTPRIRRPVDEAALTRFTPEGFPRGAGW